MAKMFVFLFTRKCLQKFIFVLLKMVIKHSSKFCFCQKNKNKFCIFATTNNLPYSYTVIGAPCIKFCFLKLYANFLTKSFLSNSFHLNVIADALGKNILTINTEFCSRQILVFSSPFLENKNTFSHKIFTKIVPSQLYSICQNASIANGGVARILNNNNNNNNNDKFSVDILLHSGLRE